MIKQETSAGAEDRFKSLNDSNLTGNTHELITVIVTQIAMLHRMQLGLSIALTIIMLMKNLVDRNISACHITKLV